MSDYGVQIGVHHDGDPGPWPVLPFLLPPESSGEDWQLFYAAPGRPVVLEIDGRLAEAEAIIAAQEYVRRHGRLIVQAEVHAEAQPQNTTPVLPMLCLDGGMDHDWRMRDGTLCCRVCDGTATQFGK